MKRFHVNLRVKNIEESIAFYSAIFNALPTIKKIDYAKWMLEDPRVHFAISHQSENFGVEHLGIQAESREALQEVYGYLKNAKAAIEEEGTCSCCYAKSEKAWVTDPQGVSWEAFYSVGSNTVYGEGIHSRENKIFLRKVSSSYERNLAKALLEKNKLPVADIDKKLELFILTLKGKVVGTGGIEYAGHDALLRSISTIDEVRGLGYGKYITTELEKMAKENGVQTLYLLTNTAFDFFKKLGYHHYKRIPEDKVLEQFNQYKTTCATTTLIMKKDLVKQACTSACDLLAPQPVA